MATTNHYQIKKEAQNEIMRHINIGTDKNIIPILVANKTLLSEKKVKEIMDIMIAAAKYEISQEKYDEPTQ